MVQNFPGRGNRGVKHGDVKGQSMLGGRQEVQRGWDTVVGGVQEEWHKMGLEKWGGA